jgi:hypothetical protein
MQHCHDAQPQTGLQGCRCGVASRDGEEPWKQTTTEVQERLPCLSAISQGKPASTTEADGESKANAVKAAAVKAAVVKSAVVGAQSWVEQQEEGGGKAEQDR